VIEATIHEADHAARATSATPQPINISQVLLILDAAIETRDASLLRDNE